MFRKLAAEFLGTLWLVLGGCGSAVLAAKFPEVGIGLVGVSLAFGLTVLTMAYAIGHISGCHLNPAVTVGLVAAGRFKASGAPGYIAAQVLGAVAGAAVLFVIASGKAGFDPSAGFATNGYGAASPGGYGFAAALLAEMAMTFFFLHHHPRRHLRARAEGLRADRHRPRPDLDPPDQHPGDQHLREPGALHRRGAVRAGRRLRAALAVLGGADRRARRSPASSTPGSARRTARRTAKPPCRKPCARRAKPWRPPPRASRADRASDPPRGAAAEPRRAPGGAVQRAAAAVTSAGSASRVRARSSAAASSSSR